MMEKIFIDTDLGGDCDDAGALAIANHFLTLKEVEILGITHTTSIKAGPSCIDIINRYYNHGFIEIGKTKRKNYCNYDSFDFAKKVSESFYSPYNLKEARDAVSLLREKLSKEEDKSVTIVCIGQLGNISDLLDSKKDQYSSLDGVNLVLKKVKKFVLMAGLFEGKEKVYYEGKHFDSEYNIKCDVKSAQNFLNKCPVEIYFSDFKVGYQIYTGKKLLEENNLKNPVTMSYKLFCNRPRESWDLLAMLFAIKGEGEIFKVSMKGIVNIDNNGVSTFKEAKEGKHYLLALKKSNEEVTRILDDFLVGGVSNEK